MFKTKLFLVGLSPLLVGILLCVVSAYATPYTIFGNLFHIVFCGLVGYWAGDTQNRLEQEYLDKRRRRKTSF